MAARPRKAARSRIDRRLRVERNPSTRISPAITMTIRRPTPIRIGRSETGKAKACKEGFRGVVSDILATPSASARDDQQVDEERRDQDAAEGKPCHEAGQRAEIE